MIDKFEDRVKNVLELWCSWLSRLLYTQKVLGSNPSSSTFYSHSLILDTIVYAWFLRRSLVAEDKSLI